MCGQGSGIDVIFSGKKKKSQGKSGNHRENKGNFDLIGVWPP